MHCRDKYVPVDPVPDDPVPSTCTQPPTPTIPTPTYHGSDVGQNRLQGLVLHAVHVVREGHQFHLQLAQPALPQDAGQPCHAVNAGGVPHQAVEGLHKQLHTWGNLREAQYCHAMYRDSYRMGLYYRGEM